MTREAIYNEMKETLGSVFGFFEVLDDTQLGPMWEKIKKTFLSDMSLGLKGNALAAVAASYSSECTHWIEFHTQTARLAGASEQNIEDVKTIGELILQMSTFFHQINYDFGRFKEEVTKAHQFIAKKMGG